MPKSISNFRVIHADNITEISDFFIIKFHGPWATSLGKRSEIFSVIFGVVKHVTDYTWSEDALRGRFTALRSTCKHTARTWGGTPERIVLPHFSTDTLHRLLSVDLFTTPFHFFRAKGFRSESFWHLRVLEFCLVSGLWEELGHWI
jgi:hypothetical protein